MEKSLTRFTGFLSAAVLAVQLFMPAALAEEGPVLSEEPAVLSIVSSEDIPEAAVFPAEGTESDAEDFSAELRETDVSPDSGAISVTEEDAAPLPVRVTASETDPSQHAFLLTLENAEVPEGELVFFSVTSLGSGAEMRYPARPSGDSYIAFTNTHFHRAPGFYRVTACCGDVENPQYLGEASLFIRGLTTGTVSLAADGQTGSFTCVAAAAAETADVTAMRAAVWSGADQGNIRWVDLRPQDGVWVSDPLNVQDFGGFGTFTVHAYASLANGVDSIAAGTQSAIEPHNYLQAAPAGSRHYAISILGPTSTDNLRAAVWSEADGQDDIVWYPALAREDGSWAVDVLTANHKSSGTFIAHIYGGDTLLGAVTFSVPASDLRTPAEERLANHCQNVYNMVGTDLHASYMWVIRNISYTRRYGHLSPPSGYTREQWYAVEGFEKHNGNCYTYAATFCQLAKHLGYNARYVEGAVYGVGQKWWPHGFVLITIDGSTYICDPELQYASSTGRNLYMQPVSSPRATYRW